MWKLFLGYDFNFNRIIPYTIKSIIEGSKIRLDQMVILRDFLYIESAVLINLLIQSINIVIKNLKMVLHIIFL